jgi:hypothetical protein
MKPTEFIVENEMIAQEAHNMHKDHEVQMARSQMYSAAEAAIEIHRLLRDISEMEGLEGWVQSKLTLASQYLESVRDYLKYEAVSQESEMMPFAEDAANYALDSMLNEEFSQNDVDTALNQFISSGGEVKKGKTAKGPRKPGMSMASKHIGGGGDKMKPSRTGRGSNPQGKAVVATEQTSKKMKETTVGPRAFGVQQTTNNDGTVTTNFDQGPVSMSSTNRPSGTVKTAAYDLGAAKVSSAIGTGFGGAGKDVQPGGNQVSSITNAQGKTTSMIGKPTAQGIDQALNEKNKKLKEMASGGGSSASGIATSMGGAAHKPTSGVPKKLGNAHKPKKVTVGKGIY